LTAVNKGIKAQQQFNEDLTPERVHVSYPQVVFYFRKALAAVNGS